MVYLYHGTLARDNIPKSAEIVDISNIDNVRTCVAGFLSGPSMGHNLKEYSIGPLEDLSDKASDVFLKPLENLPEYINIYFWADNISAIKPTLLSRCHHKWFYGTTIFSQEEIIAGSTIAVADSLSSILKISLQKDLNLKNALEVALQKDYTLWPYLRELFTRDTILPAELVSALGKKWLT